MKLPEKYIETRFQREIKKKENMFTRMSLFIILEAIESVIDSRYRF